MTVVLHACPFCRSRCVTLWTETDGNDVITDAWVECDDCLASGPTRGTEREATDGWNSACGYPS